MTDEIVILVTCPENASDKIASQLVEEHIAACVNILPKVTSIYRFEGKLVKDIEHLLVIKTSRNLWHTLKKRVLELHPYDIPEIIQLKIEDGHEPYLQWIANSVNTE